MERNEARGRDTTCQGHNIWGRWRKEHGLEPLSGLWITWLGRWWKYKMAAGLEAKGKDVLWDRYPERLIHWLLAPWDLSLGEGWVWRVDMKVISVEMEIEALRVNAEKYSRVGEETGWSPAYKGCREEEPESKVWKEWSEMQEENKTWMVSPEPRENEF